MKYLYQNKMNSDQVSSNMDIYIQGPLKVVVADTESSEKNKKMVLYKVFVYNEDRSSVIYRRYSEFQNLYEKLKKQYPSAHLKFAAKKLFSNYDSRREGLNEFINKVCSNPNVYVNPLVIDFLDLRNLKLSSRRGFPDEDLLNDNGHSGKSILNGDTTVNLGPSEKTSVSPSDFEFLKVVGKGSFGKVLLAKHKAEGNIYAVKVLNKSHVIKKNEAKHIMSERNVLVKNIQHPFLVGLYYSFQTQDKLYFVLDYVNGGELFYHLQKERSFPEVRAKFYAAEMSSAISYLHSLNIIYRDLKPENILLDSEGHVVLTDFGLCKEGISGRDTTSTFCGTPEYLAPEVLRKMPYDKTVDWWCLGGVLYEMLFGLPPFYSRDTSEMYQNILYEPLKFKMNVASLSARNFLEGLLQKDKTKRMGASKDFLELRHHPFFANLNWQLLEERKMTPPYNPEVENEMDLRHFDPEFVEEPVPESVITSFQDRPNAIAHFTGANAFEGFSYVQPAEEFGQYT